MSERGICATAHTPAIPQATHTAIMFNKTQRRYSDRPISHFPWKDFHLKLSGQGYVVGSDWAMTTFDTRTEDQFFDSKRLQTIHEGTEVRYFYPFDPLNNSNGVVDLNVVEEVRHLILRKKESFMWRVVKGAKDLLAQIGLKLENFCTRFLACF